MILDREYREAYGKPLEADDIVQEKEVWSGKVQIAKMRLARGLIETALLDKRVVSCVCRKNINIVKEALNLARWFMRWICFTDVCIRAVDKALYDRIR